MHGRLPGREPVVGGCGRGGEPSDGPPVVGSPLEMSGELHGDFRGTRAETCLEPPPEPLMDRAAPARRQAVVEDTLVERVGERVACGDSAVRPGLGAARAKKPLRT